MTHVQLGWQRHVAIENIGFGGARLVIDEKPLPGDVVTVSFAVPVGAEAFVLRARVVWVAAPTSRTSVRGGELSTATGVAFEHASAEGLVALYELISSVRTERH